MSLPTPLSSSLSFYGKLARLGFPQSYLGKFLFVAFLGVHVPLLSLCAYIALSMYTLKDALPILFIALVATLVGTGATLFVQGKLLAPVLAVSRALMEYSRNRTIPQLPTHFDDEAGTLMANAQYSIEDLERFLAMKNNFLAILSHDIRSPLTSTILGADILERELEEPAIRKALFRKILGQIQTSSQYQLGLMNGILGLARAESGGLTLTVSDITPAYLLEQVQATASFQAESKNITLTVDTDDCADEMLTLDTDKTIQVLNNLLHNAVKFTNSGGTIRIGVQCTENTVEFRVEDNGVGMEPSVAEQLFDRFSKGQRFGTSGESGTGLGLWICKTFTEAQKGTIHAHSILGKGTTFVVTLPKVVTA
jgi:signal transduction histidine kinase